MNKISNIEQKNKKGIFSDPSICTSHASDAYMHAYFLKYSEIMPRTYMHPFESKNFFSVHYEWGASYI